MNKQDFEKAQEIKKEVKDYAISIIKSGKPLVEIAEQIENKIEEKGCKPAFPLSLAVDEIAAHHNPETGEIAQGLLKADIGILYKDIVIDFAFSLDLTEDKKHAKLIESSEKALESIRSMMKKDTKINEIGKKIHEIITSYGFSPIRNLSGHEITNEQIHAGITIPNYDNGNTTLLPSGLFAVEPFSTTGSGLVIDGKLSGIYKLEQRKAIRDPLARKILDYIEQEYSTLPFTNRWIIKKFGERAKFSLKLMSQQDILHEYPNLIEKSKQPVAHTEDTFLIE